MAVATQPRTCSLSSGRSVGDVQPACSRPSCWNLVLTAPDLAYGLSVRDSEFLIPSGNVVGKPGQHGLQNRGCSLTGP